MVIDIRKIPTERKFIQRGTIQIFIYFQRLYLVFQVELQNTYSQISRKLIRVLFTIYDQCTWGVYKSVQHEQSCC